MENYKMAHLLLGVNGTLGTHERCLIAQKKINCRSSVWIISTP